jgi:hypothetical protein
MKKSQLFTLLFLITSTSSLISCSEDDEKVQLTAAEQATILLTNGTSMTWLSIAEFYGEVDKIKECQLDDEWIFTNGKLTIDFKEKCYPEQNTSNNLTWSLNQEATQLTFIVGSETLIGEIIELTATKLILEFENTDQDDLGASPTYQAVFEPKK